MSAATIATAENREYDRGITLYRKLIRDSIEAVKRGQPPIGVSYDQSKAEIITFENTLGDEAYVLKDKTLLPVGWAARPTTKRLRLSTRAFLHLHRKRHRLIFARDINRYACTGLSLFDQATKLIGFGDRLTVIALYHIANLEPRRLSWCIGIDTRDHHADAEQQIHRRKAEKRLAVSPPCVHSGSRCLRRYAGRPVEDAILGL
jgi:hypothetical protein